MDVRIRRADPEEDRDRILAVLSRNLPRAASIDRHRWLYLANPLGRSRVWLAEDAKTGEAVGTSAGHPKAIRVLGRVLSSLDLSDFAVDRPYRALGPALALLRATLEPIAQGELALSYDHPSQAMLAIYRRMGVPATGMRERWVRLLRLGPTLEKRFGHGLAIGLAARAGDVALRLEDALRAPKRDVAVGLAHDLRDEEIDRLEEELSGLAPVRLVRSSSYVRWRYLQSTVGRHEILTARRDGRLVGYAVFRPENAGVLALVDLVADPQRGVHGALVEALADLGRSRGESALWATVLAGSRSAKLLPELGFHRRESDPGVVVFGPTAPPAALAALREPAAWWSFQGDEDV